MSATPPDDDKLSFESKGFSDKKLADDKSADDKLEFEGKTQADIKAKMDADAKGAKEGAEQKPEKELSTEEKPKPEITKLPSAKWGGLMDWLENLGPILSGAAKFVGGTVGLLTKIPIIGPIIKLPFQIVEKSLEKVYEGYQKIKEKLGGVGKPTPKPSPTTDSNTGETPTPPANDADTPPDSPELSANLNQVEADSTELKTSADALSSTSLGTTDSTPSFDATRDSAPSLASTVPPKPPEPKPEPDEPKRDRPGPSPS